MTDKAEARGFGTPIPWGEMRIRRAYVSFDPQGRDPRDRISKNFQKIRQAKLSTPLSVANPST